MSRTTVRATEGRWVSGCGPERRPSAPTLDASRYRTLGGCIRICHQCGSECSPGSEGCIGGTRTRWKSLPPATETDKGSPGYHNSAEQKTQRKGVIQSAICLLVDLFVFFTLLCCTAATGLTWVSQRYSAFHPRGFNSDWLERSTGFEPRGSVALTGSLRLCEF